MQTEHISLYRRLHRMNLKQKPKSGKIIPHLLLDSKLLSINKKRKKQKPLQKPHTTISQERIRKITATIRILLQVMIND